MRIEVDKVPPEKVAYILEAIRESLDLQAWYNYVRVSE